MQGAAAPVHHDQRATSAGPNRLGEGGEAADGEIGAQTKACGALKWVGLGNATSESVVDKLASVAYLRVPANRIEPEDLADVIDTWLKRDKRKNAANPGGVPKEEIKELIAKLRNQAGPDGKPLDVGVVMTMAIGFALTVMYADAGARDTDFMSIDPNAA